MKYFHKFNSQQEFNEAYNGSEYTQPGVSYTAEGKEIDYNKHSKEYGKNFSSPFTIEALGTGEITGALVGSRTLSYQKNNGNVELMTSGVSIPVVEGDIVQFKGNNASYDQCKISSTTNFNVKGNIMSLISESNYTTAKLSSVSVFNSLFMECETIISAANLILPAQSLTSRCYMYMFKNCINLLTAPELPATVLASSCYEQMFRGCSSLTIAPKLPATVLAGSCYSSMFQGCINLVNVPELPSTTLAGVCYSSMFQGCTSLTSLPKSFLPATVMKTSCYSRMFQGCTGLTQIPNDLLQATTLANNCYEYMFYSCTGITSVPELPATTLADYCYNSMFRDCKSITSAPELPAITLIECCYKYMFRDCTSLNYVKAMFTTTPETSYTNLGLDGVSATGTFIKNSAAEGTLTGTSGIPENGTIQTAEPDD